MARGKLPATAPFLLAFFLIFIQGRQAVRVETIEIASDFSGGYQVTAVDVDNDGKQDIVALGERVAWFRSPDWREFPVSVKQTQRNINLSPYDLNGDGQLEFAIASQFSMQNTGKGGLIQWFRRGRDLSEEWIASPIDSEPTSHRLRWADLEGNGEKYLVNAPIMGAGTKAPEYDQAGARLVSYRVPNAPAADSWPKILVDTTLPVIHGLEVIDWDGDGRDELLTASREGVHLFRFRGRGEALTWERSRLCEGNQQSQPSKGSSEVRVGKLQSGERFIATIEPWHGDHVVVYSKGGSDGLWRRDVIDESLEEGHALWTADLDGDGGDEIFAGFRGATPGVVRYRARGGVSDGWVREFIDPALACQCLSQIRLADGSSALLGIGESSIRIYLGPGLEK